MLRGVWKVRLWPKADIPWGHGALLAFARRAHMQEQQRRRFLGWKGRKRALQRLAGRPLQQLRQLAVEVSRDHLWMHVAFAANGRRVAQPAATALIASRMLRLAAASASTRLELAQRHGGEHGAGPGAEILRRHLGAGDLANVVVDIGRGDLADDPVVVLVLEKVLAGQLLARADDARDAAVAQLQLPLLAGLAAKLEAQLAAGERDMPVLQRCQAIALVIARVLAVADTH